MPEFATTMSISGLITKLDALKENLPPTVLLSILLGAAIAVLGLSYAIIETYSSLAKKKPWKGFPLISVRGETPQRSFALYGRETLEKGLKECNGHPFQVMCGTGPVIVLPNKFADEIRNEPLLEFSKGIKEDFFPNYPGFEAFKEGLEPDSVSFEAIHTKLNPHLGLTTDDLVDETAAALHDVFGEPTQWTSISIKNSTLDLVARTSSRVLLGKDLCRNPRWIAIAKGYTINAFTGAFLLRLWPTLLRPIGQWFVPQLKVLRQTVRDARELIDTEIQKQARVVDEAVKEGRKPPKLVNTLRWMYQIADGRKVDYTAAQLAFTIVAMGAQSALHAQAIINICDRPELVKQLREEIIRVIGEHGWRNASLHKLELMDSYLKEIQRLHPANSVSMNRYANADIKLSDGSVIPKGSRVQVCADSMDPELYPSPQEFHPDRYLKMRRQPPSQSNPNESPSTKWQLATPQASNMGFGLGRHACPGRFFAVHHIKIALCHMLLKYDWRFVPGADAAQYDFEESVRRIKPTFKVEYRRRREEIPLDAY